MRGRPARRTRVSLVLAVLMSLVAQGVAISPAQAVQGQISYAAIAVPLFESLCVGDTVEFSVSISRTTTVNGQRYQQWVSGGSILGQIANEKVGRFETQDGSVSPPPEHSAKFVFLGLSPGETDISFFIFGTGEEARVGFGYPTYKDKVTVEVTGCYDAYTSGLATIFTEKDMGDLTEPFFLAGYSPNVGGASTETQYMFFIPNPQDRTTGGYAFIDTAWPTAGPQGRCTAYISGRYDIVFYGDPNHPVEGDALMKGTGVNICPRFEMPIDYSGAPGFQIGFKPHLAP